MRELDFSNDTSTGFGDLDDLLETAVKQHTKEKEAKIDRKRISGDLAKARAAEKRLHEEFANPENWAHRRYVLLIHRESERLIGVYSELVHVRVADCRRLVHTQELVDTTALGREYVSGPQWAEEAQMHTTLLNETTEHIEIEVGLELVGFEEATTATADVCCVLQDGALVRVELMGRTRFASASGRNIVYLPEGVDLLRCLTLDSKIAVRQALAVR